MYIYIYVCVYPWLSALYIYIHIRLHTIIYIYSYICCTIIWRTLALPNTSGSKSGYIYNKTTRRLVNLKKTHVLWCVLTSSQAFQSPDLSYWLSTPFSFGLKNQSLPKEPKAKKKRGMWAWLDGPKCFALQTYDKDWQKVDVHQWWLIGCYKCWE